MVYRRQGATRLQQPIQSPKTSEVAKAAAKAEQTCTIKSIKCGEFIKAAGRSMQSVSRWKQQKVLKEKYTRRNINVRKQVLDGSSTLKSEAGHLLNASSTTFRMFCAVVSVRILSESRWNLLDC